MINFIFCQQISTVLSSQVFIHVNFQAKTIQLIYNFNPLWINTALKPTAIIIPPAPGFNPLWINTALKLYLLFDTFIKVSIPYGLTLLSNPNIPLTFWQSVSIPYGLTLLSNPNIPLTFWHSVSIPYGLTLLSNGGYGL